MHDGQNVFDAFTSFSGEWQVDETLNRLAASGMQGIIVVAVDNGGEHRIDEYSPWINEKYGGGEGDEYMEFLVKSLKPFVDQHYRTLPDRENTGILGSSMGALISLYGAVQYQETFGKAGMLSPSLWFSEEALAHVALTARQQASEFYLMAGSGEGSSVIADLYALSNTLNAAGFNTQEQFLVTHPDGQHAEWYWAREFGDVARWLFDNWAESEAEANPPFLTVRARGRQNKRRLEVTASTNLENLGVRLTNLEGTELLPLTAMNGNKLGIPKMPPGYYLAYLYQGEQLSLIQKLEILD